VALGDGYAEREDRPPLFFYGVLMALFNTAFAAALLAAKRSGRELPERIGFADLALVGTASHKLSRLIAKDKVMAPVRAPFTQLEGDGGLSELSESSRGSGARKAIGDLLVCPYCLGLWVVAGFAVGLLFAPRLTRFVAAIFAALTISDFLQIAYKAAEEKGLG
jgi:gas vesicle protein